MGTLLRHSDLSLRVTFLFDLIFLPRLGILTASLDFYSEGENLIKSTEPLDVAMIRVKVRTVKWNKIRMGLGNAEGLVGFVFVGAVGAEMPPPWIVINSLGVDEEELGLVATTTRTLSGSEVGWDGPLKLIEDGLEVVGAGPA